MSRAIVIKRISRRTGTKGRPRSLIQSGIVRLDEKDSARNTAKRVLTQVKRQVAKDGNDRQVNYVDIRRIGGGRHRILDRTLYRVYKSESDHLVHTYAGEAHRGTRGDFEPKLVSIS